LNFREAWKMGLDEVCNFLQQMMEIVRFYFFNLVMLLPPFGNSIFADLVAFRIIFLLT
jgi:hypothetical protein